MDSSKGNDSSSPRKVYEAPSLVEYGKLKDLTTGGSGNANEGSSGKKPRP